MFFRAKSKSAKKKRKRPLATYLSLRFKIGSPLPIEQKKIAQTGSGTPC
jgi:hypothetical protein